MTISSKYLKFFTIPFHNLSTLRTSFRKSWLKPTNKQFGCNMNSSICTLINNPLESFCNCMPDTSSSFSLFAVKWRILFVFYFIFNNFFFTICPVPLLTTLLFVNLPPSPFLRLTCLIPPYLYSIIKLFIQLSHWK